MDSGYKVKKEKKTGGRKRGVPNKRTVARLEEAMKDIEFSRTGKKMLAVDHMDEMIDYLRGVVALLVPWEKDGTKREGKDEKLWFRAMDAFQNILSMRAPYQSPRLSAIAIMPHQAHQQRTTVNVTILNERGEKVYADSDNTDTTKLIEHDSADSEEAA